MSVDSKMFLDLIRKYAYTTRLNLTSSVESLNSPLIIDYLDSGIVIRSHGLNRAVANLIRFSFGRTGNDEEVLTSITKNELQNHNSQMKFGLVKGTCSLKGLNEYLKDYESVSDCLKFLINNPNLTEKLDKISSQFTRRLSIPDWDSYIHECGICIKSNEVYGFRTINGLVDPIQRSHKLTVKVPSRLSKIDIKKESGS